MNLVDKILIVLESSRPDADGRFEQWVRLRDEAVTELRELSRSALRSWAVASAERGERELSSGPPPYEIENVPIEAVSAASHAAAERHGMGALHVGTHVLLALLNEGHVVLARPTVRLAYNDQPEAHPTNPYLDGP